MCYMSMTVKRSILTEHVHSVFSPLRSLTTLWQLSKQVHPLSNALPELKSPKLSFVLELALFIRPCDKAEASLWDLWCDFFTCCGITVSRSAVCSDDVIAMLAVLWFFGLSSSDRMRFLNLMPCGFFLVGNVGSELKASNSQAHFSEKSMDFLHLKQRKNVDNMLGYMET